MSDKENAWWLRSLFLLVMLGGFGAIAVFVKVDLSRFIAHNLLAAGGFWLLSACECVSTETATKGAGWWIAVNLFLLSFWIVSGLGITWGAQ